MTYAPKSDRLLPRHRRGRRLTPALAGIACWLMAQLGVEALHNRAHHEAGHQHHHDALDPRSGADHRYTPSFLVLEEPGGAPEHAHLDSRAPAAQTTVTLAAAVLSDPVPFRDDTSDRPGSSIRSPDPPPPRVRIAAAPSAPRAPPLS